MTFEWRKAHCLNCGALMMEVLGAGIAGWIPCYRCGHETYFDINLATGLAVPSSARPIPFDSPNLPSRRLAPGTEAKPGVGGSETEEGRQGP
jgi:hypothetical protein